MCRPWRPRPSATLAWARMWPGSTPDRLAQGHLGFGVPPLTAKRDAELVVQVTVVGPQLHCLPKGLFGLGVAPAARRA